MRSLIRRTVMVAAAAMVLLGSAAGAASGAKKSSMLIVSPTTSTGVYSYGTVTVGQTSSRTFTFFNSGSAATAALSVSLSGASAFTKIGDACTSIKLKPNHSCIVIIQYAPAIGGQTDSATLSATSGKRSAAASVTINGSSAKAAPAIATIPSSGGTAGSTTITDTATLSGGLNPTGQIQFMLYGPGATANCSGRPVFEQTVTVSGDGSYTSPPYAPAAGTYYWIASYSGDTNNTAVSSSCGDESVSIKGAPAITTAPTNTPIVAIGPNGGSYSTIAMTDTATLSGAVNPTGTIEFKLYPTIDCSGPSVDDETVTVTGNGSYTTPKGYTPARSGTYNWTASYSGDTSNSPAASSCGSETVAVTVGAFITVTVNPPANYVSCASCSVTATATATFSNFSPATTGTVEFQLFQCPGDPRLSNGCSTGGTLVDDETVPVIGNGSYTTPHGYRIVGAANQIWWGYWNISYSGDRNNKPATFNGQDASYFWA